MTQNKTTKPASQTGRYFKYAVGEIILVVIGILIAIQINALYNASAKKSENKLIVKRMLKEVENNIRRLSYLDSSGQQYSRAYNLPSYRDSEINLDSCYKIITQGIQINTIDFLVNNSTHNFSSFSTFRSVYDEMLNTGKIYTLKSDGLTTQIDNYYKLLERQGNYVNLQLEQVQRSLETCSNGWLYFKHTYNTNREDAIENNQWLFDKTALEYKNLTNHIFKAKTITVRTRERIKNSINESVELINALNDYLND